MELDPRGGASHNSKWIYGIPEKKDSMDQSELSMEINPGPEVRKKSALCNVVNWSSDALESLG